MQKQSAYVRELYVVTEALAKFRHYLLGHKFVIKTDQKSLKALTEQTIQTPEQLEWLHKFLGYDFSIEYKLGKENIPADALSRSFFMALSVPYPELLHQIETAIAQDPQLTALHDQCSKRTPPTPQYQVQNGLLFWNSRLVLPREPKLINTILHEFHGSLVGGHSGIARTKASNTSQFFWPNMH